MNATVRLDCDPLIPSQICLIFFNFGLSETCRAEAVLSMAAVSCVACWGAPLASLPPPSTAQSGTSFWSCTAE